MDDGSGPVITLLLGLAAGGSALVAGVFFAFSTFVMGGLSRSGARHAVPAMQGVNVSAVRRPLMLLLFGTQLLALVAAVGALVGSGWSTAGGLAVAAAVVYSGGVVAVTAAGNVPLNNRLAARTEPDDAEAAWRDYAGPWTRLNHVRTAAATLSWALLTLVLVLG